MVEMARLFKNLFTDSKEKSSKLLGFAKTLLKVCVCVCVCVCVSVCLCIWVCGWMGACVWVYTCVVLSDL